MRDKVWRQLGLTDEEYESIVKILERKPNEVELGMFAVMWSEHCSYKSSKKILSLFPVEGDKVLLGPGENAGIIDIGDNLAAAFKIESHNHPSAIEPFQGAATGVGGIIRDIFTMGARPVALLDSLRFGPLEDSKVNYLFSGVVAGIGHYGNCVGIPTVGGEVFFHSSYRGNPLVNAMCVGVIEKGKIIRGLAAGEGNCVFLVGAKTGRDGLHGVTFASEELGEGSDEKRPAVQVGDPFTEKLLLEACLEVMSRDLVVGVQDLGGAGLTCAAAEMASRAETGMIIDLDRVPCREKGMTPYEVMLSESQERMLLVVERGNENQVREVFERWELDVSKIGRVVQDKDLQIYARDELVARVPAAALADDAPVYSLPAREPAYYHTLKKTSLEHLPEPGDYGEALNKMLASPNIAWKSWVWSQYDYMVRTSTAVGPGSDAAVVRLRGTKKALAMSADGNSRFTFLDPYKGGMIAVLEAARNVACAGAEPLAITNCLNFGSPRKPQVYWQFKNAVEGMAEACRTLGTPVTGGNVSFYNETEGEAVFPTPVVGMLGLLQDVNRIITTSFKVESDKIYLLGEIDAFLGGSEYLDVFHKVVEGEIMEPDLAFDKKVLSFLEQAASRSLLSSAHDISLGGLAVALAVCSMMGEVGCRVTLPVPPHMRLSQLLFGEQTSRVLVTVSPSREQAFLHLLKKWQLPYRQLGEVKDQLFSLALENGKILVNMETAAMANIWKGAIPCKMG